MSIVTLPSFTLMGILLPGKTTNENGQSASDCGALWQKFSEARIANKIPNKLSDDVYAVYFDYEGDHTKPFSFFIGCKVPNKATGASGLQTLTIPEQSYSAVVAKGQMPFCVMDAWREIWQTQSNRKFGFDFEVYDERSRDWNNAEVDIFVSTRNGNL